MKTPQEILSDTGKTVSTITHLEILKCMQTYDDQFKNEWRQPDMTDETQIQNLDRIVLHFPDHSYLMYNDWNWRTDSRLPDCLFVLPSPPKTTEI